ncbi:hypothetical protein LAZ67_22000976 [Cordylochernes scorpioides]|uniref:Uncharacterized protein n=1 Tax=Cordylochernes scorpioides TaxID=51811 RepID=A0ABY6LP26_9ARAC|nr:hypothetical protein LAZ67_22000976 [Cordylochernes scorpioides]
MVRHPEGETKDCSVCSNRKSKTGIPETFGLYRQMNQLYNQYGHYTANLKTAYESKAEYAEQELA